MAILRRKYWRLVVKHRTCNYARHLGYSEPDHADAALSFAEQEFPSLFYKVMLIELTRPSLTPDA